MARRLAPLSGRERFRDDSAYDEYDADNREEGKNEESVHSVSVCLFLYQV